MFKMPDPHFPSREYDSVLNTQNRAGKEYLGSSIDVKVLEHHLFRQLRSWMMKRGRPALTNVGLIGDGVRWNQRQGRSRAGGRHWTDVVSSTQLPGRVAVLFRWFLRP